MLSVVPSTQRTKKMRNTANVVNRLLHVPDCGSLAEVILLC